MNRRGASELKELVGERIRRWIGTKVVLSESECWSVWLPLAAFKQAILSVLPFPARDEWMRGEESTLGLLALMWSEEREVWRTRELSSGARVNSPGLASAAGMKSDCRCTCHSNCGGRRVSFECGGWDVRGK